MRSNFGAAPVRLRKTSFSTVSTHTRRWRFSGPVTDVFCKLPFAEFFDKNRIRCKRSLPDRLPAIWKNGSRTTALQTGDGALSTHLGHSRAILI
jgi:hypothetical protein